MNTVEKQLRHAFLDPPVWEHLHSERYWQIHHMTEATPRPLELVATEVDLQAEWIDTLREQVTKLRNFVKASPGPMYVLDTNVLLHYRPTPQIDWQEVTGEATVRLVLPFRVVEELDQRKYTGRTDLADRARGF